jgi:hypothetical protein
MQLELSPDEAKLLKAQLTRRITDLDTDLIHTDKHQLQHALALDIEVLRTVEARLAKLIG